MSKHDFWHLTLTYNPNLSKVKVNLHTEYQGVRVVTYGRTDATKYIISPLRGR